MDYPGKVITKNQIVPSQTSAPGVWTLDQAAQAVESNTWPIANVPAPISRSLRFNSADSAYLNRTPASAGNRKTWTWSGWVKKANSGLATFICADPNSGNRATSVYTRSITDGRLEFEYFDGTTTYNLTCAALLRDPSAWYHIVVAIDTTQATNTNRTKIYVNGVLQTVTGTYVPQNTDMDINNTVRHNLGRFQNANAGASNYLDGYLTNVYLIDGQALDPTYFGMTDPRTGAWIPKAYTGTYGTNGFFLNFSDNSTTAALGTDYSGNNNTWTTNNFSVTTDSDSMVDVPTPWTPYNTTGDIGGIVRGNYATLNPTFVVPSTTFSNGNLKITRTGTSDIMACSTMAVSSGKWYWEVTPTVLNSGGNFGAGLLKINASAGSDWGANTSYRVLFGGGTLGNRILYGTALTGTNLGATAGAVISFELDMDAGTLTVKKNNAAVTNGTITGIDTTTPHYVFVDTYESGEALEVNFGQRPFAYTPPAGFRSLCTTNLPEPTILDGGDYFNAVLWTGNGSTQSITGVGFQPDFVWSKQRNSNNVGHDLEDSLRGAGLSLFSELNAEESNTGNITSFDADGFSLSSGNRVNQSSQTYVGWNWKESATSGFDIVTYTGNGTTQEINHNLGVAPSMIIVKKRTGGTERWCVYHTVTSDAYLYLNEVFAAETSNAALRFGNNSAVVQPTGSVFTVGSANDVNGSAGTYVAYLFSAVPGFSAFGSYVGNGSTDGPFVYTGFRPRYVLMKAATGSYDTTVWSWFIWDTAVNPYNLTSTKLRANNAGNESTDTLYNKIDILSNGFKVLSGNYGETNGSGNTYIYAAFAENPFKYSNAR